jgi:hypothetical protein
LAWDLREEYRSKRKTGRKRAAATTTIDDAAEQPAKKAKSLDGASQKIEDEVAPQKVEEETIKAELAEIRKPRREQKLFTKIEKGEIQALDGWECFYSMSEAGSSQKFDKRAREDIAFSLRSMTIYSWLAAVPGHKRSLYLKYSTTLAFLQSSSSVHAS